MLISETVIKIREKTFQRLTDEEIEEIDEALLKLHWGMLVLSVLPQALADKIEVEVTGD